MIFAAVDPSAAELKLPLRGQTTPGLAREELSGREDESASEDSPVPRFVTTHLDLGSSGLSCIRRSLALGGLYVSTAARRYAALERSPMT